MSVRDSIIRKLVKQKLWNDSELAVEESLLGMAMINRGLIVLEGCQAILRRDYENMPGKVKIISGGGAGNEPAYAGFVGPGMLTASILGSIYSSPPSNSILKLIEEVGTNHAPGVLVVIENRPGYCINFATAVLRAENKDLNVKLIFAGNEKTWKTNKPSVEDCVQSNILFILKIAGAMAEEGRTLYEIYTVCSRVASSGEIASMNVGIKAATQSLSTSNEMEIGNGIHGELGALRMSFSSLKDTVSTLLKIILKLDSKEYSECFKKGHRIAVIVNNTGGCSQMETNIFAKEVLQQLSDIGFVIQKSYVGTMMTILDHRGFQVSLIDLALNSNILKYLDDPVKVPAWPRPFSLVDLGNNQESADFITSGRCVQDNIEDLEIQLLGPSMNVRSAQAFLSILSFACEAVIACADQLDIMDGECGDGDCGTTLADGAKAIKTAIKEHKISGINPFETFTQVSKILEQKMGGLQGGLYSLFFQAIAKMFSQYSKEDNIDAFSWLKAFAAANQTISEFGGASEGDRTMLDPLLNAQKKLQDALSRKCHPVQAFGEAVRVAEECAIKTINMTGSSSKKYQYPDPGAHAVGIWMRAAYEGVKLKFSCECEASI